MTDGLQQLKRDYRNIEAPPYLAMRIRATVADRSAPRRRWLPALATVAVAVAVISVTTIVLQVQPQSARTMTLRSPSLAMLSRMTPDKPAVPVPGLAKMRSPRTPVLPSKPKLNRANKQQTFFDFENEVLKETDHAYI